MSENTRLGIAFAAPVIVRVIFHILTGFTADDAFITFRYAENIAAGLGYVYNESQAVQGTTTPLFTLILALCSIVRIPLQSAALFVSILSAGLTGVVLLRFATSLRFTRWALLPVVCYAFWPRSLAADTGGMETALFTLLVTSALYFQHKRLDMYALGMATLATVTRPEGALLLGLLGVCNLYQHRERWLSYLTIPAVILGPWLLFAWYYFGSILPHSVTAKLALYSRFGTSPSWDTFVGLMGWHNPAGWMLTVMAIVGGYWMLKKQNSGRLEVTWLVVMLAFYTFSGTRVFFWYIVPIFPVYLLFASAAAPCAADLLKLTPDRERFARSVVMSLVALILIADGYRPVTYYAAYQRDMKSVHREIGEYLRIYAEPDAIVAAEDIGYIGFYSRRQILDRDGLVSPEAVPYNRRGDYLGVIADHTPDWVVAAHDSPISGFTADSAFVAAYEKRQDFVSDMFKYAVFARRQ